MRIGRRAFCRLREVFRWPCERRRTCLAPNRSRFGQSGSVNTGDLRPRGVPLRRYIRTAPPIRDKARQECWTPRTDQPMSAEGTQIQTCEFFPERDHRQDRGLRRRRIRPATGCSYAECNGSPYVFNGHCGGTFHRIQSLSRETRQSSCCRLRIGHAAVSEQCRWVTARRRRGRPVTDHGRRGGRTRRVSMYSTKPGLTTPARRRGERRR